MKDADRLVRIDQKLTDFIETYKVNRDEDLKKFDAIDAIKTRVDRMERPLKWGAGLVTVSMVGALTVLGERTLQWVVDALHVAKH